MRTMRMLGLTAVAIGLWLMLAPVILYPQGHWQNLVNDLAVGTIVVGAGLWRAYGSRGARWAERILGVLGVVEFLSPWLYGQTLESAKWHAWLCGVLLVGVAVVIALYRPQDQPLHFALIPGLMAGEVHPMHPTTLRPTFRRLRRWERRERRRLRRLDRLTGNGRS